MNQKESPVGAKPASETNMTAERLEERLREISEKLKKLHDNAPDMNSADWDRDHSEGSDHQWQESNRQAELSLTLQRKELAEIDALRAQYPEAMASYISDLLSELRNLGAALTARVGRDADLQFLSTNIPSIASCLEEWSTGRNDGRHWPGWAWRVVYSSRDQARKLTGIHSPE